MRNRRLITSLLGSAVCLTGLVGCNTVPREDYDAAVAESAQLRSELASARERLASASSRNSQLEQDLLLAQSEVEKALANGTTGFEGIEGTTLSSRGADVVVGVAGDVLFDSGKVDLKNSARQTLDQIASVLNTQYAGRSIRVEGYTDTDPIRKSSWKTNERLSAERAMSVEAYLVSKGIDNGRIYSAAFGPAHPRGSKAQSRRVEIVVLQ
ncbi:MAG: OmpA family protein [Phycisphaerales bacterium JB061]|jgi:chemotaxis protein MotB